jgi:hypothetical protein
MTPEIQVFVLVLVYFAVVVFFLARSLRNLANERATDPEVILRRSRIALKQIKRDLAAIESDVARIPATTEVHRFLAECDRTKQTVNCMEVKIGQ